MSVWGLLIPADWTQSVKYRDLPDLSRWGERMAGADWAAYVTGWGEVNKRATSMVGGLGGDVVGGLLGDVVVLGVDAEGNDDEMPLKIIKMARVLNFRVEKL